MKTSLSHLPEHKQAELQAIVTALIPRFAEIEMIILFGSYARGTWVEDKYVEKGTTYEYKSHYNLSKTDNRIAIRLHDLFREAEQIKDGYSGYPIFQGIVVKVNEFSERYVS
ncbi:MAG TPA: nucleotidyltransferase domain-containing protein [Bacteroidia bacterium]